MEAVRLDRAMARFDSARSAAPADAEAHRQFARLAQYFNLGALAAEARERVLELEPGDPAAWDGYLVALRWAGTFESDRRYGEKLLQILPKVIHHSVGRPGIYTNALAVAQNLGKLEAYRAILMDHRGSRPDDQVLLHHLGAAQVTLANLTDENRIRVPRDSLEAVLDELAARHDEITDADAPVLYRLAAGYNLLGNPWPATRQGQRHGSPPPRSPRTQTRSRYRPGSVRCRNGRAAMANVEKERLGPIEPLALWNPTRSDPGEGHRAGGEAPRRSSGIHLPGNPGR